MCTSITHTPTPHRWHTRCSSQQIVEGRHSTTFDVFRGLGHGQQPDQWLWRRTRTYNGIWMKLMAYCKNYVQQIEGYREGDRQGHERCRHGISKGKRYQQTTSCRDLEHRISKFKSRGKSSMSLVRIFCKHYFHRTTSRSKTNEGKMGRTQNLTNEVLWIYSTNSVLRCCYELRGAAKAPPS